MAQPEGWKVDQSTDEGLSPISLALGRIPTGLYVVAARAGGTTQGLLASFLMQVGLEPPTLCVAVRSDRPALETIREAGRFGVSILDGASASLMKPFVRPLPPGANAFDGLTVDTAPGGSPVLGEALAWLECRVLGEYATLDHVVVFAEVTAGELRREADPTVRLRKDGLDY